MPQTTNGPNRAFTTIAIATSFIEDPSMAGSIFVRPKAAPISSSGAPYAGAKYYFYATGTSTLQSVYTDSALTTPHANPVVADGTGTFAPIWLDPTKTYRAKLTTAAGVLLEDVDPVDNKKTDSTAVGFVQAGTGAVTTTVQAKLRETISVMDFGAKGDGVTDDTAAIQAAINYALSTTGVRRILFKWNHLVTDINLTKKYNCGLIFEGLNASNQDGTGSNDEGTIIVSGASSQGFDLSGSTGITFKNLTISGDAAAPPRCGIFMCRVSGSNEAFGHMFENVNSYGTFTYANVYNYAGEGGTWKACSLTNNSTVGHVWYGTSKNSLGLSSKFQTMDESVTPLTVTNFQDCKIINASGAAAATSTYGVWFERDAVRSGDRTISNINFQSCYFNGAGTASVHLENVDNDVAFISCTDESYATANPYGNVSAIKVSGANYLIGLTLINNTIFGARTNILLGDNLKNLVWLGNYCYNNKGVTITNLDGAFVSKWLTVNGTFTVTTTAPRCHIYTENSGTDNSYINLGVYANCAAADRRLNSPNSAVSASEIGQFVFDYAHKRFFIAQAGGQFDWAEVLQPIRSNSNPSSGNWIFGQIATLYDFGTLTAGSGQGLVCTNTGTAGTLVGVTGSITSGTTTLTLSTSTGLSVGNYITIVGVTGRKQIRALVGTTATIDTNADATVSGAAVAYSAPSFVEFGTVKLQGSASWTPGAISTGSRASTTLTASGAALGDLAIASFSLDVQGCSISAYVSSSSTVTVVLTNDTGSTQTLGAGTVRARVFKQ